MAARWPITLLVPALVLLLSPTPSVWAQTIQGIIVDDVSGRPIDEAVVDLVTADDRILGQDITDINGWFSIQVPDGETYQLRSGGMGYLPTLSTEFSLGPGQTIGAQLRMEVSPVRLEGLEAVVEGGIEMGLDRVGFYDRQQIGFGQVRTPVICRYGDPVGASGVWGSVSSEHQCRPCHHSEGRADATVECRCHGPGAGCGRQPDKAFLLAGPGQRA